MPDSGSYLKKYHQLEGPPIGHLAEEGQKMLTCWYNITKFTSLTTAVALAGLRAGLRRRPDAPSWRSLLAGRRAQRRWCSTACWNVGAVCIAARGRVPAEPFLGAIWGHRKRHVRLFAQVKRVVLDRRELEVELIVSHSMRGLAAL
jgi:hypothetical protein